MTPEEQESLDKFTKSLENAASQANGSGLLDVKPVDPVVTLNKPLTDPVSGETQPEVPEVPTLSEKEQILKDIQDVLREHDNKESEIPLNHHYWGLLNKYRAAK